MVGTRTILVATLCALVLPVAVFFLGAYSYSWGAHGVQQVLWAPAEATQHVLESTCTRPGSGSFVCPFGEGAHNRLFFSSFFAVYVLIGALIAFAVIGIRRGHRGKPA